MDTIYQAGVNFARLECVQSFGVHAEYAMRSSSYTHTHTHVFVHAYVCIAHRRNFIGDRTPFPSYPRPAVRFAPLGDKNAQS